MVDKGIYRGPRLNDLGALQSLQVRTILNLEDNGEIVKSEEEIANRLGIRVINIPMSGISRPRSGDLLKAVELLENKDLQPIFVHCHHGCDRTGFVIAAYKILHEGWTVEKAYRDAIENGHKWWLYDVILGWKEALHRLSKEKREVRAYGRDYSFNNQP